MTSEEFKQFLKSNGITHITSAPYHPASNGLAERAVQTVKQALKKQHLGSIKHKVARFSFAYRNTSQTRTGQTPVELIFGHQLRTRLSNDKPGVEERLQKKQKSQKRNYDCKAKDRYFKVGDKVYVKNYRPGPAWVAGEILKKYQDTLLRKEECGNCGSMNLLCGFVEYIRLWFLYLCWTVVRLLSGFVICCKLYFL